MVKFKHKGPRAKSRGKLTKSKRQKGMPNVNQYLQAFNTGDHVHIIIDPSVHVGMPARRVMGKTGKVVGKQGECYLVQVNDMNATKQAIVHPVHLKQQKV